MFVFVITGSTKGIGFALAKQAVLTGHQVVVSGRTEAAVGAAVANIESLHGGGRVVGQATDVTDVSQVDALWKKAVAAFGRVDLWINNAGVAHTTQRITETSAANVRAMVTTNMLGTIHGCQVAARGMIAQGGGKIFNVLGGGSDGEYFPGMGIYGSTKRGLDYLTRALVKELAATPVIVGKVRPGMIVTEGVIREIHADPALFRQPTHDEYSLRPARHGRAVSDRSHARDPQERRAHRLAHRRQDRATLPAGSFQTPRRFVPGCWRLTTHSFELTMSTDTKTIHEFLAESPNVDVSKAWERCFGILTGVKEQIIEQFEVRRHPSCLGREYYTSPDGRFEGSFNAYSGGGVEWLVHSWLGNRKASILDMNATCFLGQESDTPHLIVIYGTIPKLFFYADYVPRRDLRVDTEYLDRYYGGDANQDFLKLRGDPAFHWSVSHGTYMRALLSPLALSIAGDLNDANIDKLEQYTDRFVARWISWMKNPQLVPASLQAELQRYDHRVRQLGYLRDPMNKLAQDVFGADQVETMIRMRMGAAQMEASRTYA